MLAIQTKMPGIVQIGAIRQRERPSEDAGASLDSATEDGESGSAVSGVAELRREDGNGASPCSSDLGSRRGREGSVSDDMATPTGTPHAVSTTDDVSSSPVPTARAIEHLLMGFRANFSCSCVCAIDKVSTTQYTSRTYTTLSPALAYSYTFR